MTDRVPVKGNCVASGPSLAAETLSWLLLRNPKLSLQNITTSSSWRTHKFSQINCFTNTFLHIVSLNFLRQAFQKGHFSILDLVYIRFFIALTSFRFTLTGNNKS